MGSLKSIQKEDFPEFDGFLDGGLRDHRRQDPHARVGHSEDQVEGYRHQGELSFRDGQF